MVSSDRQDRGGAWTPQSEGRCVIREMQQRFKRGKCASVGGDGDKLRCELRSFFGVEETNVLSFHLFMW